jgi:hypothetical protein
MSTTYTYQAYGLTIRSDLPLPDLEPGDTARPDVTVRLGKVETPPQNKHDYPSSVPDTTERMILFSEGVGVFLVRGGHDIIVDPGPKASEENLRQTILCGLLGVLLYQRGKVVLHASAVKVAGSAAAFVGAPGSGKSTIAAALHARGHEWVAEDIVAIEMQADLPMVLPGFPQCRLWPDSVVSLGGIPEKLPKIVSDCEKRVQSTGERFTHLPVPLRRIYLLEQGVSPQIERLEPKEALLRLIPHWYNNRFGIRFLSDPGIKVHFSRSAELAKRTSVCRLKRALSLSALPEIAKKVEEDLAQGA